MRSALTAARSTSDARKRGACCVKTRPRACNGPFACRRPGRQPRPHALPGRAPGGGRRALKVKLDVIWIAYAVVRLTKKPMQSAAAKPSGLRAAIARPLPGSSASRSHTAAHASSSAPHAGLMYTSTCVRVG